MHSVYTEEHAAAGANAPSTSCVRSTRRTHTACGSPPPSSRRAAPAGSRASLTISRLLHSATARSPALRIAHGRAPSSRARCIRRAGRAHAWVQPAGDDVCGATQNCSLEGIDIIRLPLSDSCRYSRGVSCDATVQT
ncbi:hypothetical protein VTO73DRAFT_3727 [Trametes versicolor]